jgi:hypothetical protein
MRYYWFSVLAISECYSCHKFYGLLLLKWQQKLRTQFLVQLCAQIYELIIMYLSKPVVGN